MEKSITKNYNFKVKYNQFGNNVDEDYFDKDELILIKNFENIVLSLKEKNLQKYSMLELGSNQAYYSLLFKSILIDKNVISLMVEPHDRYMVRGIEQFNINDYEGHFINKSIGGKWVAHNTSFDKPLTSVDEIIQEYKLDTLTVLHSDIDGSEIPMLKGSDWALSNKKIEYAFVLTHGLEIHLECLEIISKYDYEILLDHREDNVGADRLIIAKSK